MISSKNLPPPDFIRFLKKKFLINTFGPFLGDTYSIAVHTLYRYTETKQLHVILGLR
jgi:hypothetical protein